MTNEEFIKNISQEGEEWRDIVGYEGIYMISNHGRAVSLSRLIFYKNGNHRPIKASILKQWNSSTVNEDGNYYKLITMTKHNNPVKEFIHRLVAKHFVNNPHNFTLIDHIDGNPSNNHFTNLKWCDQKTNMNNPISKERARKNKNHPKNHPSTSKPIMRISQTGEIKTYPSILEATRDGFTKSVISRCCNGHIKMYKNYQWKFIEQSK